MSNFPCPSTSEWETEQNSSAELLIWGTGLQWTTLNPEVLEGEAGVS